MKKLINILFIIFIISCTKEINENAQPANFDACVENSNYQTKTEFGDLTEDNMTPVKWSTSPADEIMIYDNFQGNRFTLTKLDGDKASFTGTIRESDKYYSAYPYSSVAATMTDSKIKFTLAKEQTYVKNNIQTNTNPMVSVSLPGETVMFKNICGVLRLNFTGELDIFKIVVKSPYRSGTLSGEMSVDLARYPEISLSRVSGDDNTSVALVCEEAVRLSKTEATEFNIVLPPSYLGFPKLSVSVYYSDDKFISLEIPDKSKNKIVRSKITNMPTLELKEPEELPDYIENGVVLGKAVLIDSKIWAPVNCGYTADKLHYGKLYQWGRKDGLFFNSEEGELIVNDGKPLYPKDAVANTYYVSWDADKNQQAWGGSDGKTKTEQDPCPEGWRVPTLSELQSLTREYDWEFGGSATPHGMSGMFVGSNPGGTFLPAAGRHYPWGQSEDRENYGYYWSTSGVYAGAARYLKFDTGWPNTNYDDYSYAFSVRCIKINNK